MSNGPYPYQNDGVGAWGMANSNEPGFAVLIKKLKMGQNYYVGLPTEYSSTKTRLKAFSVAKPYDVIKMFWNDKIGKDERGHIGIYLGEQDEVDQTGKRKHYIYWWTTNGSKTDINAGYSISKASTDKIKRAIFTRITKPENINRVEKIMPTDKDQLLSDLGDEIDISTKKIKQICGIRNNRVVKSVKHN